MGMKQKKIKMAEKKASFNHTNQGPIHEIFEKKILRIGGVENFEAAILIFFNFFSLSPWKLVTNYVLESGLNFIIMMV